MAVPQQVTARDRAIVLLTALCDRFDKTSEWRHTDVAEVVDALIDAARAPESAHTRAVADEVGKDVSAQDIADDWKRRGL